LVKVKNKENYKMRNFICIGPGRSGTTWLYEILRAHKDVCLAKNIKELSYFDFHYEKGCKWYNNFFKHCKKNTVTGEISNRYIFDKEVHKRIRAHNPHCKIIICMRDPYERIQSVYSFKLREGELSCTFNKALDVMPELINDNKYYSMIKRYYRIFNPEQIFLLDFDDIKNNPIKLSKKVFDFLGVSSEEIPLISTKKINQAIVPKIRFIGKLSKSVAKILRYLKFYRLLTALKRSEGFKAIFFKKYDYNKECILTQTTVEKIAKVINPEIEKLSERIDDRYLKWKR